MVIGAKHTDPGAEDLFVNGRSAGRVPRGIAKVRQLVVGGQGVRMVGAEHPRPVAKHLFVGYGGVGRVAMQPGEFMAGLQGIGVVRTEMDMRCGL